jgi:hypothetical protein
MREIPAEIAMQFPDKLRGLNEDSPTNHSPQDERRLDEMRPEVLAFAWLMEAKLRKHDAVRGQSWKQDDAYALFRRGEE